MAATKHKPLGATIVLEHEHERVKSLLAKCNRLGNRATSAKADLFVEVKHALTFHITLEEEIFYPAVATARDPEVSEVVKEAEAKHKTLRTLLSELSKVTPAHDVFDAKMKALREWVEHHSREVEEDMFPLFGQLSSEAQNDVSAELRRRKLGWAEEAPE